MFNALTDDLRALLGQAHERVSEPAAGVLDSSTLQSTPESGRGQALMLLSERRKGSKVHMAVDLGYPLAVHTSPADEQDRAHVAQLAEKVQEVTGGNVEMAYTDQAYIGEEAARAAEMEGIELVLVKRQQNQKGFVALPKRWVVERSFGWVAHCRRLLHDFERLGEVLADLHMVAIVCAMLHQVSQLL